MLESIEIKNFRCFKDTTVSKFGLVNLFGGLNNSGKTALLEAIYLAESPNTNSIGFLQFIVRKESRSFVRSSPKNAWDNWFYFQDTTQQVTLKNFYYDSKSREIILSSNKEESYDLFDTIANQENEEIDNNIDSIISGLKATLYLTVKENNSNSLPIYEARLVANTSPAAINKKAVTGLTIDNARFIPTSLQSTQSNLAREYDEARFNGHENAVFEAIKVIDNKFEKIETFSIGEPIIYLTRKGETKMPIGLFGDALNRVVSFVLTIINNSNSTILIDEIENGIHYTKQAELWEMLFKLSIEYNVQIFATSHSLEMIKAFAKVAETPEFLENAAYFEMARHYKTGNIIATSIAIDSLKYDIESNSPFRGE